MKPFSFLIVLLQLTLTLFSQKKLIDYTSSDEWPMVGDTKISNNGKYVAYGIRSKKTSPTLIVEAIDKSWRKEIAGGDNCMITGNNRFAICSVGQDSICIMELGSNNEKFIANANSFKIASEGNNKWLAYKSKNIPTELTLYNLVTNENKTIHSVLEYLFSDNGKYLLLELKIDGNSQATYSLVLMDFDERKDKIIWQGIDKASNFYFDKEETQLAFITENENLKRSFPVLRYYKTGMDSAIIRVDTLTPGMNQDLSISPNPRIWFSENGLKLFFNIIHALPFKNGDTNTILMPSVDIWSYKDEFLQSQQLLQEKMENNRNFLAVIDKDENRVIRLINDTDGYNILEPADNGNGEYLVVKSKVNNAEEWRLSEKPNFCLVSTRNGSRILVKEKLLDDYTINFSVTGRYLIWYDKQEKHYFTYDIKTGLTRNITKELCSPVFDEAFDRPTDPPCYGVAAWMYNDSSVWIYDRYDIWELDPKGVKRPVNITQGYGRKNRIVLRLLGNSHSVGDTNFGMINGKIVFAGFNEGDKNNGFFQLKLRSNDLPEQLVMAPCIYYFPLISVTSSTYLSTYLLKARNADTYLVRRMSATDYPNLMTTKDFRNFIFLTNLEPQKDFNWLTATIERYPLLNGARGEGIIYKPENFDTHKKYPVIFHIYQKHADGMNKFLIPHYSSADIDIPWFVSHGYIVFLPDIYYKAGHPGESVFNSVVSAIKYLSNFYWFDSTKLGLQGFSFGGYEVNELITRTNLFTAAASGAGFSDFISGFGSLTPLFSYSNQLAIENGYCMGSTPWDRSDLYVENSPVFRSEKVSTPFLILHNKNDIAVPWSQSIEYFTALRRLGKKVWMLQYDGEEHGLKNEINQRDYSIRLAQFFDHYLKGTPEPKWMTIGVDASKKGVESGLELDLHGEKKIFN